MHARVTTFDIDVVRISLSEALEKFRELVLPALQRQRGYRGLYVMDTPEGKGLLLSLWETAADAEAGLTSGYYEEQIRKFFTLYRQPPGREHYEVVYAEVLAGQPA